MDSLEFCCGRYWRYPDITGQRRSEGGTRLIDKPAQKPFFSIITAVRNMEDSLEATICSVLEQKFQDFEYIIIDGLSDDGSLEIIQKYQEHISYYISEPDDYLYHAMEKGIELAQGSYINLLNADDCFADANVLAHVAELLQQNPVDYLIGASYFHDGHEISSIWYAQNFPEIHWPGHEASHQTYFIQANIYSTLGRFSYQRYQEAGDLYHKLKLIKLACSKIITDQILIKALNNGRTSNAPENNLRLNTQVHQDIFPKNLDSSIIVQLLESMRGPFRHEQIHKIEVLIKELPLSDRQRNAIRQGLEWHTGKRYRRAECFPDRISVILLCENTKSKAIQNCLRELETQTYQNLEYIVISGEDLTNLRNTKILRGEIDIAQIRQATEIAQGEYIFICHVADSWDKAIIDRLYNELKLRTVDFAAAYTDFLYADSVQRTEPFFDYVFQEKASIQDVKLSATQRIRHFPSIQGKLYRREFLLGQANINSVPSLAIQLLLSAKKSLILSRTRYRLSLASFYAGDPVQKLLEDCKLPEDETKIHNIFDKIVYLQEGKKFMSRQYHWYLFAQLSGKHKLWVAGKVLSKKLGIYKLLQPLAKRIKSLLGKK